MAWSVQRVVPPAGEESWTVLDPAHDVVAPVDRFLSHLSAVERSPATVRSYAFDLRDFVEFLDQAGVAWERVQLEDLGRFVSWLRLSPGERGGNVTHLPRAVDHCSAATINRKLSAVASFYQFHQRHGVECEFLWSLRHGGGTGSWRPFLAHLDESPRRRREVKLKAAKRTPRVLTPDQVTAIVDACDHLRDRLLFALLAETGMRLGEVLGMRISDFVMGRGQTPYVEVVPREGNPNGARVKMMRPRRVYVGADLERLFADYLTHLACRASELGLPITADGPLLVNVDRPPLLAPLREGTVRDKVSALRRKGIGAAGWSPHWFRHSHATALLLAGTPEWVVARRLGHAHVQTTLDLYGWVREDEALRAAANWKTHVSAWRVSDDR